MTQALISVMFFLQGQAKLYNEVVGSFEALKDDIRSFKEYFVEDTAGIPVFGVCVKLLRDRCGECALKRWGMARGTSIRPISTVNAV